MTIIINIFVFSDNILSTAEGGLKIASGVLIFFIEGQQFFVEYLYDFFDVLGSGISAEDMESTGRVLEMMAENIHRALRKDLEV
ncbi:MAG: hypothetical protein ACOX71_07560 [Lachnospiraceae bacterium]